MSTTTQQLAQTHKSGHADNDDAQSIRTVVQHELERVKGEDEEDDQRRQVGLPRTAELMGMGMDVADDDDEPHLCQQGSGQIDKLTQCLNTL